MDRTRSFAIGPHTMGSGKCFVIGEAGVNHNGDRGPAHELIDTAAAAGADELKFRTFKAEQLISTNARGGVAAGDQPGATTASWR